MWLFIFAGLLAVSVGKETVPSSGGSGEKSEAASSSDDIVMLEIDVKEPVKRSPLQASTVYGSSPSQYVIRHGDDAQELTPEYLSLLQQYTHSQPQPYASPSPSPPPPQRRPLSGYARQQQQLQQAYYNFRKPAVVPPRPRTQLHPQALAQAEVIADAQYQAELQNRAEARALAASPSNAPSYQVPYAGDSKLGTFEQELLQLVSANQAQEFKLTGAAPAAPQQQKRLLAQPDYSAQYAQQLVSYPSQYAKGTALEQTAAPLHEQYHIETTVPRYQPQPQRPPAAYQAVEEPVQVQYQEVQPIQAVQYQAKASKPFRPSARYYPEAVQHTPESVARAQAQAEAQALAYQKISQAAHNKHQQDAFEQIRIVNERHRQQSALEQIQQGAQVSDAGRTHIEEQYQPKDPEAAYRARLKAQAMEAAAEARRAQEAAEYKAHADAILKLQAQQQAHLKVQDEAHKFALNFERNQLRAQAQAQAIAQAQAEALYKAHQQARAKANSEAQAAARAQAEARKVDPDNTPVVQYLLPNSSPLPSPNSYLTSDQLQKYQTSGSSYVPRSAPKSQATEEQAYIRPPVTNQPRQAHKHKISPTASSIYVSQSGLLKKSPVKSVTIEEEAVDHQQEQPPENPHVIRVKAQQQPQQAQQQQQHHQLLTQEQLSALINAGYTITPVPEATKSAPSAYQDSAYYAKKGKAPLTRPEYVAYEETVQQRPEKPLRKNKAAQRQEQSGHQTGASEKITYLIPLEPVFGTKQPPSARSAAEE